MSFESDIFKQYRPDPKKMLRNGFVHSRNRWTFRGEIMFGKFQAEFRWSKQNVPRITICEDGEEYSLIHVESADGDYVRRIRDACIVWLTEIRDKCFAKNQFCGEQANRIADALLEKFGDMPDDPWQDKYPGIGVFRLPENRKWYAIIMNIEGKSVQYPGTNCDVLTFRSGQKRAWELLQTRHFIPAYHMNHTSWVSAVLDDSISDAVVLNELSAARELLATGRDPGVPVAWLVPVNLNYHNVFLEFGAKDTILWKQSTDIRVNDIVYLYIGAPYSAILYQCLVLETDIPYQYDDGNVRMNRVMKIKQTHIYSSDLFTFEKLKKFGVYAVRGPRKIAKVLREELEKTAIKEEKKRLKQTRKSKSRKKK